MGKHFYFLEKISEINYRMATHEGDANRRLASEAKKIILLPESVLPQEYNEKFHELKSLIKETLQTTASGTIPIKLGNIRNSIAVKYIKLLIEIELHLRNQDDS